MITIQNSLEKGLESGKETTGYIHPYRGVNEELNKREFHSILNLLIY
jgi:hypothetical protein